MKDEVRAELIAHIDRVEEAARKVAGEIQFLRAVLDREAALHVVQAAQRIIDGEGKQP